MKHMKTLGLIALIGLAAIGITACAFSGDTLTGTKWHYEVVAGTGTGMGLHFTSATAGAEQLGVLGTWTDQTSFTYTYDAATKTGVITYGSGTGAYSDDFTLSGQTISYNSYTYKYAP
jgi:hypothetical protein